MARPIAFFVIAIGEYPTSPSKPSPGTCRTSNGCSLTIDFLLIGASSELTVYS
nr:MAG TPA: hypothetical protein [Caudoviricetes sp.]